MIKQTIVMAVVSMLLVGSVYAEGRDIDKVYEYLKTGNELLVKTPQSWGDEQTLKIEAIAYYLRALVELEILKAKYTDAGIVVKP